MMLTRDRFREHAFGSHVIPTRSRWRLADVALVVVFVIAVLGAYVLAARQDASSDASVLAAAQLERQRLVSHERLMLAYEAGMADGVAAVRDRPEGVAFAQACLAMRGGL